MYSNYSRCPILYSFLLIPTFYFCKEEFMFNLFRNRKKSMHLAVLLALMVVLLAPVGAAYADGEPPPEPPPVEEVGEPESVDSPGEDGAVDEAEEAASPDLSDSEPDGEIETPPADAPAEETQPAADGSSAIGGEPSVTDSENVEGEEISIPPTLAGQLGFLPAPDPFFVIGPITYQFFGPAGACGPAQLTIDCTDNLTEPIQEAFDYLSSHDDVPDDNTVYVEAGTYAENPIIDGSNWTTTTPAQLILQGLSGSGATTIDGSLTVQNLIEFVLQGFTVTGGVTIDGNSGAQNVDDVVGSLTIQNTTVDGAPSGNGLTVSGHIGDIQVTNSSFNNNPGSGMVINTSGSVLVEDVEASGNQGGDGANIIANAITARRSVFNDNTDLSFTFPGQPDDPGQGLFINSLGGPILVENVTAMGNEESGGYFVHNSSDPANEITVANSTFRSNQRFGVYAQPNGGTVTFNCIHTSGNTHGATLVPIGETVEWIKCECKEKHEKELGYTSKPLSQEFPVTINAGNGVVVTFPAIEKIEEEKVAWGQVEPLKEKQLPGALPPEDAFRAGVKTQIMNAVIPEGSFLTIEFYIPGFMMDFEFMVYWWDAVAEEWVDVPFTIEPNLRSPGGRIVAEWPETGIFVLVTQ
jgi:hypothetical protein